MSIGYSFDKVTKEIRINEKERKIVEYIFESYINNKSLFEIANNLNNLKNIDPTFQNKLKSTAIWRGSTVRSILKNKWYALGIGSFSGEEFQIKDELRFIDIDIYYSAQEKLSVNKHKSKAHTHSYILNDLIHCSCGAKVYPKVNKEKAVFVCSTTINRELDKKYKCFVDKQIQIEKLENAIWLLIKDKLDDFKIEITKKSNKELSIKNDIENKNNLINSIRDNTIENLKNQRERTITTFNKFGGDDVKLDNDIKVIDNAIKIEEKNISKLKSDIKLLEMSINSLDIAEEIKKNITSIENDKNQIKFYCKNLIKRIEIIGLKHSYTSVFKIEWNDNVNNDKDVYLIYNTRKDNYYYINEVENISVIAWNSDSKSFNIYDLQNYTKFVVTADEIIHLMNLNYDDSIDEIEPEISYIVLSKQNSLLNLIKCGQSKLKILTPFK